MDEIAIKFMKFFDNLRLWQFRNFWWSLEYRIWVIEKAILGGNSPLNQTHCFAVMSIAFGPNSTV